MPKPKLIVVNKFGFPADDGSLTYPAFIAEEDESYFDNLPNHKYFDISYCNESPSQKLDIYMPVTDKSGPFPAIVYLHGGSFYMGSKSDVNLKKMMPVTHHGFILVSCGYRRSPEAKFPACVLDARTAIRFLRSNADKYNIDINAIAVWGLSSGGWIAGILGATNGNLAFEDKAMGYPKASGDVQASIVSCAPCGRFTETDTALTEAGISNSALDSPSSYLSWFIGNRLSEVEALCRMASITDRIHKNIPPFFIQHGTNDSVSPFLHAKRLVETIKKKAGTDKVEFDIGEGIGNADDPWFSSKERIDKGCAFLRKVLCKNE